MKKLIFLIVLTLTNISMIYPQWFNQNSGTNDNLGEVHFVNEQTGWMSSNYNIYKTTNGGEDWNLQYTHSQSIIDIFFINNFGWMTSHSALGTDLYRTVDGGENWLQVYAGNIEEIFDFEFINLDTGWCVGWAEFGYLFKETNDGGLTWIDKSISPDYWDYLISIEVIDNMNFIIAGQGVLFKSTDGGNSWIELPIDNILYLQFFNMNLGWAKSSNLNGGFLLKTTNGGNTWNQQVQPMRAYQFTTEQIGWYINNNQIYYSTDGGNNWMLQNSNTNNELLDIFFLNNDNGWIVGENGTILYTPNGGLPVELISFIADVTDNNVLLNWQTATETNNQGFEVQRKSSVGDFAAIGFIEGKGTTTEQHNYSFTDKSLSEGKYSYRLKQIDFDGSFEYSKTIDVEITSPLEFSLSQNYPNPFNPSTKISWQSPVGSWQTLKVYDMLGNLVTTLVDEYKPAGSYEVEFKSTVGSHQLANGIYFYQLKADNFVETKKMILLK